MSNVRYRQLETEEPFYNEKIIKNRRKSYVNSIFTYFSEIKSWRGIFAVVGGCLIHLTLGSLYSIGNMNTYVTSYLHENVDKNAEYSQFIWVNALAILGQGLCMPIGGFLTRKIGPRWTALIGCSIFSFGTLVSYFSVQNGFILVAFTYGLVSGCGLGIAYVVPLVCGMKWFPDKKGFVNGVIVGGFGLGALIFNQVQTGYLNPNNIKTDADGFFHKAEILDLVPKVFLLLGGVYIALEFIGFLLLCDPPETWLCESTSSQDLTLQESQDILSPLKKTEKISMHPLDALKTKEFYMLWLSFSLGQQPVQYINTMYKAFGQRFIKDDQFLSLIGSFAAVWNSCGRIIWGMILDRSSFRTCIMAVLGILSIFLFTLILTEKAEGKAMFTIWIFGTFFTFSGLFVLYPTGTALTFGHEHAGTIYGMVFTGPAVSSVIAAELIQKTQPVLGWFGSFSVMAAVCILAAIISLFYPKNLDNLYTSTDKL